MPVLPFIEDSRENVGEIVKRAEEAYRKRYGDYYECVSPSCRGFMKCHIDFLSSPQSLRLLLRR